MMNCPDILGKAKKKVMKIENIILVGESTYF